MIRILCLVLLLVNCQTVIQSSARSEDREVKELPKLTDIATMRFEVDGKKFSGTGTVTRKSSLNLTYYPPNGTLQFTINTCHREVYLPRPQGGAAVKYTYVPAMYLENLGSCLVTATAITENGETHVSILELHQGLEETLPATVKCNGEVRDVVGADLCQANATDGGKIQRIEFPTEVVYAEQAGCAKFQKVPVGIAYEWAISPGLCVYKFMDKDKRKFRLTTYGYTSISDTKPEVRQ